MVTYFYFIAELQAFLVACYHYKYLRGTYMKWFIPFLGFIFLGDCLAWNIFFYLKLSVLGLNYFLHALGAIFYCFIFYHFHQSNKIRKSIVVVLTISLIGYLLSYLFLEKNYINLIYNSVMIEIFIIGLALSFLYKKIISEDNLILTSDPGFWVSTAVILFFSTTIICFLMIDFIRENDLRVLGLRLYNFVPQVMSVVLYSFLSTAIILYKKNAKAKLITKEYSL